MEKEINNDKIVHFNFRYSASKYDLIKIYAKKNGLKMQFLVEKALNMLACEIEKEHKKNGEMEDSDVDRG